MRKFLKTCAEIEKTVAEIYRCFADRVSCDEELKDIWRSMAQEEDQHALEIGFASRLPQEGMFKLQKQDQGTVDRLLETARQILWTAKTTDLSPDAAVNYTLQLEQEFLEVHIVSAVEFEQDSMRKMFQSIVQSEEVHCQAIKDYRARH